MQNNQRAYLIFDANVIAAYYLPHSSTPKINNRVARIISLNKVKGRKQKPFIFFIPNFCVAEIFNVLRKYRFGKWNKKVIRNGTISKKKFENVYSKFQKDIHNGKLFYHLELSRYHLLNTAFISPIDHHYAYGRTSGRQKKNPSPMSTFDLLIIAMGIELVRLHGNGCVKIVTTDNRIYQMLDRAKKIKNTTAKELGLFEAGKLVGRNFSRSIYPDVIHLGKITMKEFDHFIEKYN